MTEHHLAKITNALSAADLVADQLEQIAMEMSEGYVASQYQIERLSRTLRAAMSGNRFWTGEC